MLHKSMFNWLKKRPPASTPETAPAPANTVATTDPIERSESKRIEGNAFLENGQLDKAVACYTQAVALDGRSVGARVNLAYVLIEQQLHAEAEPLLLQAVAIDASNFDSFYMLGGIATARGELASAIRHYEKAIELKPDLEPAYRKACQALVALGEHERADAVVRKGLSVNQQSADLHFLLGNLRLQAKQAEDAIESYARALSIRPDHVEAHSNMALALRAEGRLDAAAKSYRQALAIDPGAIEVRHDLSLTLQAMGQGCAAVEQFQRVVALQPDHFDAHSNLGAVLQSLDQADAAIRSYRLALALKPNSAPAHCNLGLAFAAQGKGNEAIEQYERALECDPGHARSHSALAVERNRMGQPVEAVAEFRTALALDPNDIEAHSSMMFLLSFVASPAQYLEEARRYGAKVTALATPLAGPAPHAPPGAPVRLRVGLVSGDLRMHPVALFLEAVMAHLDPSKIELFAYVTTAQADEMTQRLKRCCVGWASIVGMDDEFAARRIHADGIHVLIDLAGHTAHNRLSVFAWKPAPVQVSWLGYFASTGVPAMDYLLADRVSVPEQRQDQFTEKVWYLPQTRLCFTAPTASPMLQVSSLPALRNGHVTFGSFQTLGKINDAVLEAWVRVLLAMPGSRLRMQAKQLDRPETSEPLLARLASVGIGPERVSLVPPATRERYLAAHNEVDMILDTFPYPGGTTTCEALWMGVPTLTLAGDTMLSRQGASMLRSVGLDDWVATDLADYVACAVHHASDLESLARLRAGLREQALASPLFDAARFARDFEQALLGMRQQALDRSSSDRS